MATPEKPARRTTLERELARVRPALDWIYKLTEERPCAESPNLSPPKRLSRLVSTAKLTCKEQVSLLGRGYGRSLFAEVPVRSISLFGFQVEKIAVELGYENGETIVNTQIFYLKGNLQAIKRRILNAFKEAKDGEISATPSGGIALGFEAYAYSVNCNNGKPKGCEFVYAYSH